jgi:hypothetical protein
MKTQKKTLFKGLFYLVDINHQLSTKKPAMGFLATFERIFSYKPVLLLQLFQGKGLALFPGLLSAPVSVLGIRCRMNFLWV